MQPLIPETPALQVPVPQLHDVTIRVRKRNSCARVEGVPISANLGQVDRADEHLRTAQTFGLLALGSPDARLGMAATVMLITAALCW
jgi:hypothetical protein